MVLRACDVERRFALVEEAIDLGVAHARAVRAGGRNRRRVQEDAQHVGLGELRDLQRGELEVAGAEPRDERAELERHDLDVDADVGELLRDDARDGDAQSIGRREQRQVQATRVRLGERCCARRRDPPATARRGV